MGLSEKWVGVQGRNRERERVSGCGEIPTWIVFNPFAKFSEECNGGEEEEIQFDTKKRIFAQN